MRSMRKGVKDMRYLDQNGLVLLWERIKGVFVAKAEGMGLSSNDYTVAEKGKLAGVSAGATKVVASAANGKIAIDDVEQTVYTLPAATASALGGVSVGSGLTIDASGALSNAITKVSQVANDSGYQTTADVSSAVTEALGGVSAGMDYQVVSSLPQEGQKGVLYLLEGEGADDNIYDEYIWQNGKYELLGSTKTDLAGYLQKDDLAAITNAEIAEICA